MKINNFYNQYSESYLKLSNSEKYNAYHDLYLKLNKELNEWDTEFNILFIHMSEQDIDYLTFVSDIYEKYNVYMSGLYISKFFKKYYYEKISNIYENYEFLNFNYIPKFNKENWKKLIESNNKIDLIILPCKIVSSDNVTYFKDKKLIKFIKSFSCDNIIGVGYDFSNIGSNDLKKHSNSIKLNKFISINSLIKKEER